MMAFPSKCSRLEVQVDELGGGRKTVVIGRTGNQYIVMTSQYRWLGGEEYETIVHRGHDCEVSDWKELDSYTATTKEDADKAHERMVFRWMSR